VKLFFTASAAADLKRLREFISEHDPAAAERVAYRLRRAIERLTDFPRLGKAVEEFTDVRELIAGAYAVRYRLSQTAVTVLRIWHGKEISFRQ
jgi:plasmid stabilization system protein ParE